MPIEDVAGAVKDLIQEGKVKHFGLSEAEIALAWLLAQKPWIVPIPGTRNMEHLDENLGAVEIELTLQDLREMDSAFSKITVQGARLSEEHMKLIDR